MVVICAFVHVLINWEKRQTFHRIEKSVAARLDVEEENKKQVNQVHLALSSAD